MKIILQVVLTLAVLTSSFFAGYFYKSYSKETPIAAIETSGNTQIIKHSNIKQTSKKTTFTTTATGEGTITTIITNPELPKYSLLLNYSVKGKVGVQGLYRYENVVIGAGVTSTPDLYVSAGLIF